MKVGSMVAEASGALKLLPIPGEAKRELRKFLTAYQAAELIAADWIPHKVAQCLDTLSLHVDTECLPLQPSEVFPLVVWLLDHTREL